MLPVLDMRLATMQSPTASMLYRCAAAGRSGIGGCRRRWCSSGAAIRSACGRWQPSMTSRPWSPPAEGWWAAGKARCSDAGAFPAAQQVRCAVLMHVWERQTDRRILFMQACLQTRALLLAGAQYTGHQAKVTSIGTFSGKCPLVASRDKAGAIHLWSSASGSQTALLPCPATASTSRRVPALHSGLLACRLDMVQHL